MFPPGDAPPANDAVQRQRTQRPGGALGGMLGQARQRQQAQPPMQGPQMQGPPSPMGGMGAPPGLGGNVPPPAQRMAMMRSRQMQPPMPQGPMQGPTQAPGMPPMQFPQLKPFQMNQQMNQDPMMQQKMAQARRPMMPQGMIYGG